MDSVGLMSCGRPYGEWYSLAALEQLAETKWPYQGLQTKWQGTGKSKKLQVMASNVGFC